MFRSFGKKDITKLIPTRITDKRGRVFIVYKKPIGYKKYKKVKKFSVEETLNNLKLPNGWKVKRFGVNVVGPYFMVAKDDKVLNMHITDSKRDLWSLSFYRGTEPYSSPEHRKYFDTAKEVVLVNNRSREEVFDKFWDFMSA